MTIEELRQKLDETQYVYDENMLTVLYVALTLGRPLLIEGAAGVGKTEVAKVMAAALDRELVRLQCYEGLDESKALYEWNYQKQLLTIQIHENDPDKQALTKSLFSDEFLLERLMEGLYVRLGDRLVYRLERRDLHKVLRALPLPDLCGRLRN